MKIQTIGRQNFREVLCTAGIERGEWHEIG